MQNLVISLKTAIDRRKHIKEQFESKNIAFQFFDALTPDLARPLAEKMKLNISNEDLSPGELACFMSHISIWQKIVDENIPYLAIFEDDIFLGEQADRILNSYEWIEKDWDIIKLEAFADRLFLAKEISCIKNTQRTIRKLNGKNLGTAGYILSQKGAKAYLDYVSARPLIPLDEMMFDIFIKENKVSIYQVCPAICIQEMKLYPNTKNGLTSELLIERKQRMKKHKKKGWLKIKGEIIRILIQLKYVLIGEKAEFR
ncbi:glycosyltransferase family 25 protein [Acinetobacter portensis]|uniref:Glycosyltransferase family 25 protein n=1 Tax=Acinetobacter portensis TaxID=1839785 RepID=A0ABY4JV38_9GAMM|nr:glycosyltransferase family 25 protein [Acinetobacter portensis]MCK7608046.1 glycosyltransferase family 25 protein [Acinetobacter portensis]MCK7638816.1 glycosyltransferase family 25 protein [Acinetobacter portensis]UPO22846.1 glycosyltransferase family 25 protein [Acinetobacter portensis]